jgi:hypothetical protein
VADRRNDERPADVVESPSADPFPPLTPIAPTFFGSPTTPVLIIVEAGAAEEELLDRAAAIG